MKAEIEALLNSGRTAYSIGKATGLNINMLQKYINGERKVGNMTLDTAEKLYQFTIDNKSE